MFKIEIAKYRVYISLWKLYIELGYYSGETGAALQISFLESCKPIGWNLFYVKVLKLAFSIGIIF